ncbi:DNA-directed RNA polymerase subunit alpha C-terminal domain-containing protein [Runella slithyformis]|uniref:RNA polymerase alpha subunit C-terminal domain-containing protein n=1 Tax=Runella slithyformis (strain ATCC 29530 / DSM 19594 / LMG 11500 / NCIMB 11436 / LSU 4) TaxID=761193 RepID=A0A7U3ZL99_RUNSL|nr:DNA-directed RNA polymerase subunit alpha C-terminal domain-containing protein [Runella slithyformis]AEI49292.1 hypothetical protein Runsl_2904 [Runella slithyformis DSM 19594]
MDLLTVKSTSLALFTVYKNLPKEVQNEFQLLLKEEKQTIETPKPEPQTYYGLYFKSWDTDLDTPRLLRSTIGVLNICGIVSIRSYNSLKRSGYFFIEDIMKEYKEKGHLRFIEHCGKKTEAEILATIQRFYTLKEQPEELFQNSELSEEVKFALTSFLRPARNNFSIPVEETSLSKKAIADAHYKGLTTINDLLDYYELFRTFGDYMYNKSDKGVTDKELLTFCLSYLTPQSLGSEDGGSDSY